MKALLFVLLCIFQESLQECFKMSCSGSGGLKYCSHPKISSGKEQIASVKYIGPHVNACQEGYTYGFQYRRMWVDLKCGGEFRVCYLPASSMGCTIKGLASGGGRRVYVIDLNDNVRLMTVFRKPPANKAKPCIAGETYGKQGNKVWVDKGCKARFLLCMYKGPGSFNANSK